VTCSSCRPCLVGEVFTANPWSLSRFQAHELGDRLRPSKKKDGDEMFWKRKKRKSATREIPVVLRVGLQKLVPMNGHVVVELPSNIVQDFGCFRKLSESLADTLVNKADIDWDEELDFDNATTAYLDEVEWVTADEWNSDIDSEPTYRCSLNDDGEWQVVESSHAENGDESAED
jgi:hypothetical protein